MATREAIESFLGETRNIIVGGVRKDGRAHLSPNWFYFDGERFYVSTTRSRVKAKIFRRDPRATLVVDDATGFRAVCVSAHCDINEDLAGELGHFRAIRLKYGAAVPDDAAFLPSLQAEERVLLVFTPDEALEDWPAWGLD